VIRLPGQHSARALEPIELLADDRAQLRADLLQASDAAFGRDTSALWASKFSPRFLNPLKAFYLIEDRHGRMVGWSGHRSARIEGERVVYFTSTGLLPSAQGQGLVAALQRYVIAAEGARDRGRAVTTAVRTRNPWSYRLAAKTFGEDPPVPLLDGTVPPARRRIVAGIASWLGLDLDPTTGRVADAYEIEGGLYGSEPKTGDARIDALFARLGPNDALLVCGRRAPIGMAAPL
jgi:hypothetical protein